MVKKNTLNQKVKTFRKQIYLQLMVIPWIVWLIIFAYIPMAGLVLAFKEFNLRDGIFGSPWVGLTQFKMFFESPDFFNILRNTLAINLLRLVFSFPAPIILALLINELSNSKLKRIVQSVSYLPHFMSWVILAGIVTRMLSSQGGLINEVLMAFGFIDAPIMFMGEEKYFWWITLFSGMWKETGWSTILYLAAISGVDTQIYEAAVVDGASRFKRVWYITLPSILPTLTICLLFTLSGILSAGFEQLYLLGNPMVIDVAEVLDTYIYKTGISAGRYSYATAAGFFTSAIGFTLIASSNWAAKKLTGNGIW